MYQNKETFYLVVVSQIMLEMAIFRANRKNKCLLEIVHSFLLEIPQKIHQKEFFFNQISIFFLIVFCETQNPNNLRFCNNQN